MQEDKGTLHICKLALETGRIHASFWELAKNACKSEADGIEFQKLNDAIMQGRVQVLQDIEHE